MEKILVCYLVPSLFFGVLSASAGHALDCSGTVRLTVGPRAISLVGDQADNCVIVHAGRDTLEVEGRGDTLVHHVGDSLPDASDVVRVKVRLGDGNDRIEINDVISPGSVWTVRGGADADFIGASRLQVESLRFDAGAGEDTVIVSELTTAKRVYLRGGRGRVDNLILTDELVGSLSISAFESHQLPPLRCPIAEESDEGDVLRGLEGLEIVTCCGTPVAGDEEILSGEIEAVSAVSGETYDYDILFHTALGQQLQSRITRQGAWIRNSSTEEYLVLDWNYYSLPTYWRDAFHACYDLILEACPDHLNQGDCVVDPDPTDSIGDADGPPV